jgi:glycoprotein 3-alpha-L-fucosyltransferase
MDGVWNYPWITTSELARTFSPRSPFLCGVNYKCSVENGSFPDVGAADLVVFIDVGLPHVPPQRNNSDQLWMFYSEEPQQFMDEDPSPQWNNKFNYSFTFNSFSEANDKDLVFASHYRRRNLTLSRNFAVEKRRILANPTRSRNVTATALWFVSNCIRPPGPYDVHSNRMEYAHQLSEYIDIDGFSGNIHPFKSCVEQLGKLYKDEDSVKPQYNNYWFYLSFENSYCKEYITEKFWNILTQDLLVIPIALGGTSVEEYERVAPPNSFIHVDNFTSAQHLAEHLNYVVNNEEAFNYYLQWRNEYEIITHREQGEF